MWKAWIGLNASHSFGAILLSTEMLPVMLRMYQSEEISDRGPLAAKRIDRLVALLGIAEPS
jgi:hypothetical protein